MKSLILFSGRVSRRKFLMYVIPLLAVYTIIFLMPTFGSVLIAQTQMLIMLTLVVIFFSFVVRRLHDLGRPTWHLILVAIPIYGYYLLILLFCRKGVDSENQYSVNPSISD